MKGSGPAADLLRGVFKTTMVHRHAFIPDLSLTREIGRAARLPDSFEPAVTQTLEGTGGLAGWAAVEAALRQGRWARAGELLDGLSGRSPLPGLRALRGVLRLYGGRLPREESLFAGLIERYAGARGARELERLTQERPRWWPARLWWGLAALRRCELPKARASLEAMARLRPDWSWSYLLRAEWGRVDIEFKTALGDLDAAIALDPRNPWAFAFRSRLLFQMAPGDAGLKDLDLALSLDPESGWIHAWRGDARRKLGDRRGALRDLLKAKALEPAYDRTYLWLGKTFGALGDWGRALSALDEAFGRCRYFEKASAERSRVLRRLGRCREAVDEIERAVAVNHRHNWLGNWTVEPLALTPEQSADLELLRQESRLRPRSARVLAWLGEARVQAGQVAEGLSDLEGALRLNPRLGWAWAWRGEALLRAGRLGQAERSLERSVRLDPGYGRAWAWRGRLRQLQGRPKEALADYSRAVADSLIEYSWLYFWKAQAQLAAGRRGAARRDAASAVSLEPRRAQFREWLAKLEPRRPAGVS